VEARTPLYQSLADYTADTSTRPIETIVEEIARWVEDGQSAEEGQSSEGRSTEQGES
jgi:shikimate kinase